MTRAFLDQIHGAPVGRRGGPEHEQMRAGIVGDQLRFAGAGEIGKARVGNFDRGMQGVDGIEHLLHAVGRRPRRQVDAHAEGKFRLGDRHLVAGHRGGAAVGDHGFGQDAPGHGAGDIDMLLSGFAGGGDLPAEQMRGRIALDRGLDRITLGTIGRPVPVVKCCEFCPRAPVVMQRL